MTRGGDSHPNLRQRKHSDPSPRKNGETGLEGDEMKPLLTKPKEKSSVDTSKTDGYVLMPLRERSILARLDVGPFLLCYGFLVSLDLTREQHEDETSNETSAFSLVAFPLVLFVHLGLFLVQQWSVSWRATVGYQRVDTRQTRAPSTPSNTLLGWTHCLVTAPHVDQHQSSHDAGIVPVVHRIRRTSGSDKDNEVLAVVNFQDIVFRCNIVDDTDADTSLWSNDDTSDSVTTRTTADGLFHRLKYPINLPLSFYDKWRGHKTMELVRKAQQTYGTNTTPIDLPPFIDLLQEQVVAPFFLFQILCVLLWSLDEYWYYAMFTFFALLMFESTVAYNRLKSLERLRSYTVHSHRQIWVHRPTYPPLGKTGWVQISVSEIVPGDIVSCKQSTLRSSPNRSGSALAQKQHQLNQLPADILLLNGDAVVDESQITGESVPQLKVALENSGGGTVKTSATDETLDLQEHKQFILFGGTTLLVSHSGASPHSTISEPPDHGAIGMVLRTGFETAQGSLLRTMAHTQKSVDGIHTRDTYAFILTLLCMAVASAYMVWEEGSNDPTRNKFRLLLHVVIIITSVVPPELPMELSLAVTNSVADLIRRRIFCTENFRIPLAGQVNMCCFDKTGTLTSDEMQLTGLRLITESGGERSRGGDSEGLFTDVLEPNATLQWSALRIMTACHSLAPNAGYRSHSSEDDRMNSLIGDPLEKAILENTGYKMIQSNVLKKSDTTPEDRPDAILILQRFGFSSKLKRMSVLARESSSDDTWVLTKGAPETVKTFLRPDSIPENYDDISMHHMGMGQRVLAMAYKKLTGEEAKQPIKEISRETVESDLVFAGFLLMHCPIKPDSSSIISELWNSGNEVVMITGDAILTAAEVARQVGIIRKKSKTHPPTLQLKYIPDDKTTATKTSFRHEFHFVPLSTKAHVSSNENLTLSTTNVTHLKKMVAANELALCISGDALQKLVLKIVQYSYANHEGNGRVTDEKQLLLHPATQDVLKDIVPMCNVFARCNPRQKEAIVAAFNLGGFTTLMCGDGTNDVGALRRAHVGISIISAPGIEAKQRSATKAISQMKADHEKERKKKRAKKGSRARNVSSLEQSLRELQEAQHELDQIELGDASIASPFTSRMVSIKCCKVVLQQGRCTLVTMLQIYKILGVNCLVNAMVLSKLFLHGVKQGDRQLTILGLFVAGLFFFVTRGKPLPKLSERHPPDSVLSTEALVSIASQFAIHYTAMIIATEVALSFVDPFDPSMIPDGPFNPNTLNTCTFLISVLATINTFAVNYRGEPFVEPLRDNKMLWRSLQVCYTILAVCALEIFPPLNDLMQLAEFPDTVNPESLEWMKENSFSDQSTVPLVPIHTQLVQSIGFKTFMIGLMACDTFLVFASEKIILKAFER